MTYTDQEKATIITKYRQGKPVQELCAEYGICARTIYRWAKHYPTVDDEQFLSPKEYKKTALPNPTTDNSLFRLGKVVHTVASVALQRFPVF